MRTVVQFAVVIVLLGSTLAADGPVYNVTSGPEDYTLLVGRSMQARLDICAVKLASVKVRHADRIESIENQQQLVIQEIQQYDNSMLQYQALSLNRKHCVQKYKPYVPTINAAIQNFTLCIDAAESSAARLTQNPEYYLAKATRRKDLQIPAIFQNCNNSYAQESNVANCVTVQVDDQLELFNSEIDQFEISLQDSLYLSSTIAAEATRCSFVVEKRVLASNGAALSLSDVCSEELQSQGKLGVVMNERNVLEQKLMERLKLGNRSFN